MKEIGSLVEKREDETDEILNIDQQLIQEALDEHDSVVSVKKQDLTT